MTPSMNFMWMAKKSNKNAGAHKPPYNKRKGRCRTMKKFKIFVIIALVVFGGIAYNEEVNHYKIDAIVYEVGADYVTFEDVTGNLWDVDKMDVVVGDKYELTFDTMGTDSERVDDEIINIKAMGA